MAKKKEQKVSSHARKGINQADVVRAFKATMKKTEGGNKAEVARVLGISRGAVQHHLRKAGLA